MPRLDRVLMIVGFICLIIGLLGAVLPLLPGSILSMIWLLLIHITKSYQIPNTWLIVFVILVILANLVDYYLPIWWTKQYGWTKAGITGSTIGMIAGIFLFPPLGMIILPFVGAFLWEYLITKSSKCKALRSAWWSFVWFLLTTGYKVILGGWMLIYGIQLVW